MENCSISLSAASFRTLYLFFLPSTMIQWLCLFSILGYVLVHILVSFLFGSLPNGLVLHTISPCTFSLFSPSFLALSSTMNLYPQDVIHSIDNLRFDKQPSPSFLHGYAYLYDKLYSSSLSAVINRVLDASSNVHDVPLTFWTRRYSIWAYASIKTRPLSSRLFPFWKKEFAIPP